MNASPPSSNALASLRCFVSAARDVERPTLSRTLTATGVEPVFLEDLPTSPLSATDAVQHALRDADFVVGVLSESADNSNVMFELGVAVALDKPVVAVIPRRMPVPTHLDRQLVVRGGAGDDDALRFAVEQLSRRLGVSGARARIDSDAPLARGTTLGAAADELLGRLDAFGGEVREIEFVQVLHDAFRQLGLTAVEGGRDARFDLGIWDSELKGLVGNPFVIEVKQQLHRPRPIADALTQVEGYLAATSGNWALLVYGSGDRALIDEAAWARPILTSSVRDVIGSLRDVSFAEFVRRLRAERVHGGPERT